MQLKTSFPLDGDIRLEAADFRCGDALLAASILVPRRAATMGVVFVVGGPQYRIGSHRQFFELARACAHSGHPALVFDPRGLGDSEGEPRAYHQMQEDIRRAIDTLIRACPGLERVLLLGLCDGATAALLYASTDHRVIGLLAANPWLEAARSQARSRLKEYYASRLLSRGFWADLLHGRLQTGRSLGGVLSDLTKAMAAPAPATGTLPSPDDVARAASSFDGPIHLILSGRDVTARVCAAEMERRGAWAEVRARSNFSRRDILAADHTFSRSAWHDELLGEMLQFLERCANATGAVTPSRAPRARSGVRERP